MPPGEAVLLWPQQHTAELRRPESLCGPRRVGALDADRNHLVWAGGLHVVGGMTWVAHVRGPCLAVAGAAGHPACHLISSLAACLPRRWHQVCRGRWHMLCGGHMAAAGVMTHDVYPAGPYMHKGGTRSCRRPRSVPPPPMCNTAERILQEAPRTMLTALLLLCSCSPRLQGKRRKETWRASSRALAPAA